ncbi:MAG TPA: Rieske (2Fe-2S) protein [Labilithrix sp.]|nr:Rieske (2Fe-2S) protein [Labilithrix sp.]
MLPAVSGAPTPEDGCMTRRAILATLTAAALSACSGTTIITSRDAGTGTDAASDPDAGTDAATEPTCPVDPGSDGPVTSYPQGTWKAVGAYIIGHDANGLFAFSTTCTHQGCTISAPSSTGATSCPCHGARFDGNGAVTVGPARTPLPHYALTVCGGNVYVDTGSTVAATTRTPAQ